MTSRQLNQNIRVAHPTLLAHPTLGYDDKHTVKTDWDNKKLKVVKFWSFRAMKFFKLQGFIILRSSRNNYHVVFDRSVSWARNLHIVAWLSSTKQTQRTYRLARAHDINSELVVILLAVGIAMLLVSILGRKHPFGITRKRAYRLLFIGISLSSFFFALITFLRYPSMIASTSYDWLIPYNFIIGGVSMSSLVFFIASILWDTLVGSAFAVLEHLLEEKF